MSAKQSPLIEIETPVSRPGSDRQRLFWMQEHAFCVHLNLRGDSSNPGFPKPSLQSLESHRPSTRTPACRLSTAAWHGWALMSGC